MAATVEVAKRLYYDSPALEFSAVVTDIRLDSRDGGEALWQVALDRTAFYPEGGGQPWDTGVLVAVARSGATLEVPVERVEEDAQGEVWHFVRKPLVEGAEVTGYVDAERRADHEQQHSGQHLISAVFLREAGAKTVSFHMGAESSTIDLVLRAGADKLTTDELARVEEEVNRVVMEARPLVPHWVERGLAQAMLERGDLRKLPERDGPLRIVQMQGIEFNACGGTHVTHTSGIGPVLLRKVEKVRQGWRVEFLCGLRAVRASRQEFMTLGAAAQALSVGAEDVPGRVAALVEQAKKMGKERQGLVAELAAAEAYQLDARFAKGALIDAHYFNRDLPFLKGLASGLAERGRGAVLSAQPNNHMQDQVDCAIVLLRPPEGGFHAGDLMKSFLSKIPDVGGRGGGNELQAQMTFRGHSASFVGEDLARLVKEVTGKTGLPDS